MKASSNQLACENANWRTREAELAIILSGVDGWRKISIAESAGIKPACSRECKILTRKEEVDTFSLRLS